MAAIDKPGSFYIGKQVNLKDGKLTDTLLQYEAKNLTTHALCVGMTGSGKTGLGIGLLEEAALNSIPALIIDPKGDLGNLLLAFPELQPAQFQPWIDEAEATRNGETVPQYAATMANRWKEGLQKWGEDGARIKRYRDSIDLAIYTPASSAGIPLSILNSFAVPPPELMLDAGALRDKVMSTVSSLLGLLGIDADPLKSREHILISTIMTNAWKNGQNLDLPTLIQQIQKPPFNKIGVLDTETFYPQKDRVELSIALNNLLASPGFQAWMEGEPLDIQRLLYTQQGKPRFAIISIAHLSDPERMFFVTLLLNELISWMRRQSGTSSLKAILYMDEIFGYFPPNAMPPSKTPMLTLLKQARAYGVGIMLCTQNPVDLDYKGLANCGTWMIGKLQTERDKARVFEGIKSTISSDNAAEILNKMIAACGPRVFILHSVYLPEPTLFQTRWTLSYLKGPLTLPQIQTLMQGKQQEPKTHPREGSAGQKPFVPTGVQEYFAVPKVDLGTHAFSPRMLGVAKLHFVDAKSKIDAWQDVCIAAPVAEDGTLIQWDRGEDIASVMDQLQQTPPTQGQFTEVPAGLLQLKNYSGFQKSFAEYLYQCYTYDVFYSNEAKQASKPEESENDFRARLSQESLGGEDAQTQKIRDKYQTKIRALQDKIRRAQEKVATQTSQAGQAKMDTLITTGTAILGSIFGRGSVYQAGASLRKASKVQKESQDVARATENVHELEQQLQELTVQMNQEIAAQLGNRNNDLQKVSVRPRKSDIAVKTVAILWT